MLDGCDDDEIPDDGLDVVMLPPENATGDVTDEDSGTEEGPNMNNLPGSQLNAEVVIFNETLLAPPIPSPALDTSRAVSPPVHSPNLNSAVPSETPSPTSGILQAVSPSYSPNFNSTVLRNTTIPQTRKRNFRMRTPSPKRTLPKYKKKMTNIQKNVNTRKYTWREEDLLPSNNSWILSNTVAKNQEATALDYFKSFFDEEVIHLLVEHTNRYAARRSSSSVGNCAEDEMWSFIGVLLLSGYVALPRKCMYWQKEPDTHNKLVSGALSRDRFNYIMSNLHVCDNNRLDKNDRFTKIQPLLHLLNERFKAHAPDEQNHSIDESMVPYFGKHGAKQFIRGRPLLFTHIFPFYIISIQHVN